MLGELAELPWRELEPAHSYASRLAAHYGCVSVNEFLADFDINEYRFAAGQDHEIDALARLTGTNAQLLRAATPKTKTGTFTFGGEKFSLYYSRRKRLVGCAECISEDLAGARRIIPEASVYMRQPWLLSPIMTCAKHCRPLSPLGGGFSFDQRYDYSLRLDGISERLPELLANTLRRDESEFELYVRARLTGSQGTPNWLDGLGLNELFGVCANLGLKVMDADTGFLELDEGVQHAAYQAGYAVLKGGQDTLRNFFNQVIQTRELKLPLGPASLLGRTYTALLGSRKSWEKYAPILEPIANAVYDVLPTGPKDAPIFGVPINRRRIYTLREAGVEFGIVPKTLLGYSVANGAANVTAVSTQHGPRKWVTIDATAAERLFREPLETGWRKRLRTMGMSAGTLTAVLTAGLLNPMKVSPEQSGHAPLRVGEVDQLITSFLHRAETVSKKPQDCSRLLDISKSLDATIVLHRQIREGRIWVGRIADEARPYAAIVVKKTDIDAALGWADHLNVSAASKLISLDEGLIYSACESGLIIRERKFEPRSGKLATALPRKAVEELGAKVIGLIQLAQGNPRRAGTLSMQLEAKGIIPAIRSKGARAYFREEVSQWLPGPR